jgi:signal transduction histidine kinase
VRTKKIEPRWLLVPLAVLVAALVSLVLMQTESTLSQLERAQQDKARTLARTIVSAVRGVARYGPDKEGRLLAVIEEVSNEPGVLSVGILDASGEPMLPLGTSGGAASSTPPGSVRHDQDELRWVEPFDVSLQCQFGGPGCGGGGCGRGGGGCGGGRALAPGRYQLALVLDARPAASVRRTVLLEGGGLAALTVVAAIVGWLLLRSVRQKDRLARDVELERQRSESLESLRLLGAGLAHEIRNPLGAIRGFTQLIHEQATEDETRDRSALMLSELDRIEERVEELLAFARRQPVRFEPVDLSALAAEVVALVQADADGRGISLRVVAPPEAVRCAGDRRELEELLLNVVLNAVQASDEGGSVEVALEQGRDGSTIAVKDTGKGIAPNDLPKVFEPYFTTRAEGSGLGLAIAKRIADAHGARITVHSALGRGTTVRLILPPDK